MKIFLNDNAYWGRVPEKARAVKIGGYQVAKKWLSYREQRVLGRSLTIDEARQFTSLARRLTAIVQLAAGLDENYERCATS